MARIPAFIGNNMNLQGLAREAARLDREIARAAAGKELGHRGQFAAEGRQ